MHTGVTVEDRFIEVMAQSALPKEATIASTQTSSAHKKRQKAAQEKLDIIKVCHHLQQFPYVIHQGTCVVYNPVLCESCTYFIVEVSWLWTGELFVETSVIAGTPGSIH